MLRIIPALMAVFLMSPADPRTRQPDDLSTLDQAALAHIAATAETIDVRVAAARRIHQVELLAEVLRLDSSGAVRAALERLPWRVTGEIRVTNFAYPEGTPAANEIFFVPLIGGIPRIDKFNGKVLNPSAGTIKGRFTIELKPNTIAPTATDEIAVGQEFTLAWPVMSGRRRPDGTFATEVLPIRQVNGAEVLFRVNGFARTIDVGRIDAR